MPRKLTATTGVLLVLAFAGCGKDDKSATSASSAAPTTAPATTTTAGAKAPTSKTKASTKKSSAAKKSSATKATAKTTTTSKATDAQTTTTKEPAKQTATTKKKQKSTTTTATTKNPVSVTPAPGAGAGADPSSGTGSGSKEERLAVVAVLRRYYKAFSDRDGATACSLLTDQGKGIMKADGGAKTCAASVVKLVQLAGSKNVALLETTRDGLHVDDITITGNNATAQIGKISRLRLVQQDGRWLLRSPNVVNGSG